MHNSDSSAPEDSRVGWQYSTSCFFVCQVIAPPQLPLEMSNSNLPTDPVTTTASSAPLDLPSVVTGGPGSSGGLTLNPAVVEVLRAAVHQEARTALSQRRFQAPVSPIGLRISIPASYLHRTANQWHGRRGSQAAGWLSHSNTRSSLGRSRPIHSH